MPVAEPIIKIEHLTFAYGGEAVLDDVSLTVNRGNYVGVVGPNGGDKTTLLKILVGLLPVGSGRAEIIAGSPLTSNSNARKPRHYR